MKIKDRLLGRELTEEQKGALHQVFENIPFEGEFDPEELAYRKYKRKEIAWIRDVKVERVKTRKGDLVYSYSNISEEESKKINQVLSNLI